MRREPSETLLQLFQSNAVADLGALPYFGLKKEMIRGKRAGWARKTIAWLAQLVERQFGVWDSTVRDPDRTNTQGLKISEENVLPL